MGDHIVALSTAGTYRFDGVSWSKIAPGVSGGAMTTTKGGDVFVAKGREGLQLIDEEWVVIGSFQGGFGTPYEGPMRLFDVWAESPDNIWVAGSDRFIGGPGLYGTNVFHYDGTTWRNHGPIGPGVNTSAVWAASAQDVFIGNGLGDLSRWDGARFVEMDVEVSGGISDIWGRSATDVYAVGGFGAIHFDGQTWSPVDLGVTEGYGAVRGFSNGDLYFWGGAQDPLRFNGATSDVFRTGDATTVTGMVVKSQTDIVTATTGGLLHYDGTRWRRIYGGGTRWTRVWVSPEAEVFAVGERAAVEKRSGSVWQPMDRGDFNDVWNGIWGRSSDDFWVVGNNGDISHYDGQAWTAMQSGTILDLKNVTGWEDRLVAVGSGTAVEFDGNAWHLMLGDINNVALNSVWGSDANNVFAVGDGGALRHYDGSTWTAVESGVQANLNDIWGSSAENIFVVGDWEDFSGATRYKAATILHFDGLAWSRMESRYIESLRVVWGNSPRDIFALGWTALARYDGRAWGARRLGDGPFMDIDGTPGREIFVLNQKTISRFVPTEQ